MILNCNAYLAAFLSYDSLDFSEATSLYTISAGAFCAKANNKNKSISNEMLNWNPAATYPPGPCPAKYFRR